MNVLMPQLGETVTEGTVANWHKKVGDKVVADEIILDIETDKVSMEIPAPGNGFITQILVPAGDRRPGRGWRAGSCGPRSTGPAGAGAGSSRPSGSSPLAGSSSTRTGGSPSSAAASASRWRMPSEYPRTRRPPSRANPTSRRTASIAAPGAPTAAATARRCARPLRPGCIPGSSKAPTGSRGQLPEWPAGDRRRARVGAREAEQDPQRGRLAGAVAADEAGDRSARDARSSDRPGRCARHRPSTPR